MRFQLSGNCLPLGAIIKRAGQLACPFVQHPPQQILLIPNRDAADNACKPSVKSDPLVGGRSFQCLDGGVQDKGIFTAS
jgi:hypothetical protein